MKREKLRISDLHFDHKLWMNELKFFEMQLDIFEERLEEVVPHLTENAAKAALEVFQNRMIRQREVIDELKHKFRLREKDSEKYDRDSALKTDHILYESHRKDREEMQTFIKLYHEMRESFMRFLADHW